LLRSNNTENRSGEQFSYAPPRPFCRSFSPSSEQQKTAKTMLAGAPRGCLTEQGSLGWEIGKNKKYYIRDDRQICNTFRLLKITNPRSNAKTICRGGGA